MLCRISLSDSLEFQIGCNIAARKAHHPIKSVSAGWIRKTPISNNFRKTRSFLSCPRLQPSHKDQKSLSHRQSVPNRLVDQGLVVFIEKVFELCHCLKLSFSGNNVVFRFALARESRLSYAFCFMPRMAAPSF